MKKDKILFFDIDGTMYIHKNHEIVKSTQVALRKLKEAGYQIGVATSRCMKELEHLPSFFHEFDFDIKIVDGGSLIFHHDKVIKAIPIDQEDMLILQEYCNKHHIFFRYSTLDNDYYDGIYDNHALSSFFELYLMYPEMKRYDQDDAYNVLIYAQDPKLAQEAITLVKNSAHVVHTDRIIEFTNALTDKSVAIQEACTYLGYDIKDAICFGDGPNDVKMIQKCGYGVAMGNSNPTLMQEADYVCEPIDQDGIYKTLVKLQLIKEN